MISASVIIPVKDEFINLKLILPILKKKYNFCEIIIIDKSSLTQKKKLKKFVKNFQLK